MCLQPLSQKSIFISDNLGILTQPTVPRLMNHHFTRLHKQTSIKSPNFAYFMLSIIFAMCKPNLIVISPTPGAKRSQPLSNNIIDRPIKYSYNHEQLINMSYLKYCKNLLNLSAGTIKTIRDLWLNRWKIRTKICEKTAEKQANIRNLRQVPTVNLDGS